MSMTNERRMKRRPTHPREMLRGDFFRNFHLSDTAMAAAIGVARIKPLIAAIAFCAAVLACTSMYASASSESAKNQVWDAELAFARTMADRNLSRFSEFVAEDAVFFAGTTALRGKSKVVEGWAQYFTEPDAPFSWEPDQVEVLESGSLAFSTGPVRDPTGKVIARFNSIWRLEASGQWRVVFDKGSPPSPGPK